MQPQNPNVSIDLDLIDKVVARIPEWAWCAVKQHLVTVLMDDMPTTIIERLTGNKANDHRAQEILDDYYAPPEMNNDLIVDSFKILGEEHTLHAFDALQLDKITQSINETEQ
jgi:hypothetical protein